jgi:putative nucleotidyltransferase with HDIG domain
MEGITQKGEFQLQPSVMLGWLIGAESPLSRRDWALVSYALFLPAALATLLFGVYSKSIAGSLDPAWPLGALALSALVAERQSVRLGPRTELSVSFLPIVLAAVIYGPYGAVIVSVCSLLMDFGAPYGRWLVWTSARSLAAAGAGVAAMAIDGLGSTHSFASIASAVSIATIVEQFGDLLLGSLTAALRGMSLADIRRAASTLVLTIPLYAPVTAILVYAYRELSPWSVVFFLIPAFAAQKLFLLYQEQRATSGQLAAAVARQERAHFSFASALVATLDARDQYTAGHSAAVAIYARDIAKRLGLSEEEQRRAHLAGLVHDIGKIGLAPGLVDKPGPLTLEERRQMQEHSVIGERILSKVEDYSEIALVVRHHHERVDGEGYPDGLAAEEIPLLARIISVADAYNAMTSDRPYRDAMPSQVARLRLAQAVGSQFDTAVVAAFEAVLAGATERYRAGSSLGVASHTSPSRALVLVG